MILLMALLGVLDLSGARETLYGLDWGFPMPSAPVEAPGLWNSPEGSELFFRIGFSHRQSRVFHCGSSGVTAGARFFTAAWFSKERWAYLLESPGLFRFSVSEDSSMESAVLRLGDGRLSLGMLRDSMKTAPFALWESRGLTAVTGLSGAGFGFAPALAENVFIGPAFIGADPWLKVSIDLGGFRFRSGPGIDGRGRVRRAVSADFRGPSWILAGTVHDDSTAFAAAGKLLPGLSFGLTGPEWGSVAEVHHRAFSLFGSTSRGRTWSTGVRVRLPWARASAWGTRADRWELGFGLELGRGFEAEHVLHSLR